jgi:hypothetical protein
MGIIRIIGHMAKSDLIKEFEEGFDAVKKGLGFKASLNELDSVFFLRDFISKEGFVSTALSRQVCARINETLVGWYNYMHSIIMPNPGSMLNMTESQAFSDEEKQELMLTMNKIMAVASSNTLNGLTKDKKEEARFIDNALSIWNKTVKPKGIEILKKVNANWKEKSKGGIKE